MAAAAMDDTPESLAGTASPLGEDTTATIIAASFDPTLVTEYLAELAVVALNATREDLRLSFLSYPDTLQRCSRFAADPNTLVLYLRKETGDTSTQIGLDLFQKLIMFRRWQNTVRVLSGHRVLCWPCNSCIYRHSETTSSTRQQRSSSKSAPVCPSSRSACAHKPRDCVTV